MKKITLLVMCFISFSTYSQYLAEGFEGTAFPPTGWTTTNTNANQNWRTITGLVDGSGNTTVSPTEGTLSAAVLYDVALQDETLTTPDINLTAATSPELKFDANISYAWAVAPNDNFDVTISVIQGTTVTPIWSETDLGVFNGQQWYEIVIDLTPYVGSIIKLEFNYEGADGDYLVIDDVKVDEAPACGIPSNLSFVTANLSTTTADITWGNTGDFEIEYGLFPYALRDPSGTTDVVTAGSSYQLTGLTPGVSYNVFVRQNCSTAGLLSDWEEIIVGTLPSASVSFPFSENLELDANQALLLNLGVSFFSNTNNWSFGQDDITDGDTTNDRASNGISFFFSNNTFSNADADATLFFGPFTLTTGNQYTFSFDQRNSVVSNATRPNKDIELIAASTNDGATNTVLATFDDMNNITYQVRSGTFSPASSGDYYFGIRDKSTVLTGVTAGNSVFADAITISSTLSLGDINEVSLNSFFNSRTNSLNVEISQGSIEAVEIYNLLGQQVVNQKFNESSINIKMDAVPAGVYIAKVAFEGTTQSVKFIKK
jgi:hypothetical protein